MTTVDELLAGDGSGLKRALAEAWLALAADSNTSPARKADVLAKLANTLMRLQAEDRADERIAKLEAAVKHLEGEPDDA